MMAKEMDSLDNSHWQRFRKELCKIEPATNLLDGVQTLPGY